MISYQKEDTLDPAEFVDVLRRSTLAERRPVDDPEKIEGMCSQADIVITARDESGLLIGVSRSVSDFVYCTYLSDLAVDENHQKQGIGKKLIDFTRQAAPSAKLILLAAPAAMAYYPKIGMEKHDGCFVL